MEKLNCYGGAVVGVLVLLVSPSSAMTADSWQLRDGVPQPPPFGLHVGVLKRDAFGLENLALRAEVKPSASSSFVHRLHRIEHLNDGRNGNDHSWILGSTTGWVQYDFGRDVHVCRMRLASDATGGFNDRAITAFSLRIPEGEGWKEVFSYSGEPIRRPVEFWFGEQVCRRLRLVITGSVGTEPRIDEWEVFGAEGKIPEAVLAAARAKSVRETDAFTARLAEATSGEELAWLKQEGWADIEAWLRQTPYPERKHALHHPDDTLPLPELSRAPKVDGTGTDPVWRECSRGVARVGALDAVDAPALVEQAAEVGYYDGQIYIVLEAQRFLSSHLALIGVPDKDARGLVMLTEKGLALLRLDRKDAQPQPLVGVYNEKLGRVEMAIPLKDFPEASPAGIYVGMGIRGRWTHPGGRPIFFHPAGWSVRSEGFDGEGAFRLQLRLVRRGTDVVMTSPHLAMLQEFKMISTQGHEHHLLLAPEVKVGTLGPYLALDFEQAGSPIRFRLSLFRYDPASRAIGLYRDLLARRGLDLAPARAFDERRRRLLRAGNDLAGERALLREVRTAKRALLLRDPALQRISSLLVSKRHPFHPSHNYSVQFDSPWRPGGNVSRIDLPFADGALHPEQATVKVLAESGAEGVIRDPSPSFDATRIYYAHRRDFKDYYRIYEQNLATGERRQISDDGPFHDFWPTPLPDGGLAFISTRCRKKFICWRPQAAVLYRMGLDGRDVKPLSFANLTEFAPSVMDDGRILWTRSEYADKGADYGHTVWTIRSDGTYPELTYGNTIALPQGFANARMMPGSKTLCATMISHFGDLNGPIALVDLTKGPHDPTTIRSLTPEVPWPGFWARSEAFREPYPLSEDLILVAWAPQDRFGIYVIDVHGNRELLYADADIDTICPIPLGARSVPPVMTGVVRADDAAKNRGRFALENIYRGVEGRVAPGAVKWLRVCEELPTPLKRLPDGSYQADHDPFESFYASPTDIQQGAWGWASFIAKGVIGLVPVEPDGSAHFTAPAGKVLYFQMLDKDFNEIQRMRSVVQLQPGESRSCIGCHESRLLAPDLGKLKKALVRPAVDPIPPPWGAGPFWYEKVVQPVLDRRCVTCHSAEKKHRLVLEGTRDREHVPVSWRSLLNSGQIHYFSYQWQQGVPYKAQPYTFGTSKSRLWETLANPVHREVKLTSEERQAIKCWTDLNCPLWGDYAFRGDRGRHSCTK